MKKTSRNDPCPCGSRKKFKRCCLPLEQTQRKLAPEREEHFFITEIKPDLDETVNCLMQRLDQGEGKLIESEITKLLEDNPSYHLTNYAMGVYQAVVEKNPASAIRFLEKAVLIFPQFAQAHFNLGTAAEETFDIPKAVEAFRAAKRYSEDGEIAKMARKELKLLERAVLENTAFPNLDAYVANARLFDRAFKCLNDLQFEQAVELFQRVLSENPKHVQSYGNLALAYAGLGRRSDALACFDRALELDSDYEPAIKNRRIMEQMREGEPFIPVFIKQVDYYANQCSN
jgi:tetratricopeptide (TPR) repeat protein